MENAYSDRKWPSANGQHGPRLLQVMRKSMTAVYDELLAARLATGRNVISLQAALSHWGRAM